ncbi:MAG: hypothetical protein KDE20_17175, partial [Caldilineaceae bacterium]|nr:hypothetical protein [Caldilineaceae bacterium]
LVGCYDTAVYGVGMFDVGSATIDVPVPPGPIVAAYIEWVGVEDTTPGGDVLDGTSQLTINGVTVDDVQRVAHAYLRPACTVLSIAGPQGE